MHALTTRSIRAITAGTSESNSENIRRALTLGLPEFTPAFCAHDGNMVIVGSGPSLPRFVEEIRQEREKGRPICAIKGAGDFLIENGIEPDLFVSCEPRSRPLQKISEHTVYLLASRCPPDLFEQLKGKNVVLWHSFASKTDAQPPPSGKTLKWEDFDPSEECEVWKGHFGVGGASTSGLRAFNLVYLMGFRKIILYGFDSCLAADRDTKRFSGEKVGTGAIVDVIVAGKRFWCNGALAQQATEFQKVIGGLVGLKVEARGDGLIAAILKARAAR